MSCNDTKVDNLKVNKNCREKIDNVVSGLNLKKKKRVNIEKRIDTAFRTYKRRKALKKRVDDILDFLYSDDKRRLNDAFRCVEYPLYLIKRMRGFREGSGDNLYFVVSGVVSRVDITDGRRKYIMKRIDSSFRTYESVGGIGILMEKVLIALGGLSIHPNDCSKLFRVFRSSVLNDGVEKKVHKLSRFDKFLKKMKEENVDIDDVICELLPDDRIFLMKKLCVTLSTLYRYRTRLKNVKYSSDSRNV